MGQFFVSLWRNLKILSSSRLLNFSSQKRLFKLFLIYNTIDRKMARVRRKSGLRCPKGCGQCCENPYVETTVFEMLPLAVELWNTNKAEPWVEQPDALIPKGRCSFYTMVSQSEGKGYCSIYPFRPLICRMFGFSAKRDKTNGKVIVTCNKMKQLYPKEFAKATDMLNDSFPFPMIGDYRGRVAGLASEIDKHFYPLPLALHKAVVIVGLRRQLLDKEPVFQRPIQK